MEEAPQKGDETPTAGGLVRAARLKAGIEPAKLCADLRISTDALEALEAGQYRRLPGDPYVRALLVSLARQLRLDPQELVRAYSAETGAASAAAAPIAPYKDPSQTHVMAHKQIFILILAVLLFTLLLILGKLNSSGDAGVEGAPSDSLALAPAGSDTLPESNALRPDTLDTVPTTGLSARPADTTPLPPANRVVVKPLLDSVWIRVLRAGKPETVQLLLLGKQMEVTHSDTIALILGKSRSVQLSLADTTLIPARKRFRIVGNRVTYY